MRSEADTLLCQGGVTGKAMGMSVVHVLAWFCTYSTAAWRQERHFGRGDGVSEGLTVGRVGDGASSCASLKGKAKF